MSSHGATAPEPAQARAAAARLLAAIATELSRRLVGSGTPAWAEFPTAHLQSLAQGALTVTVSGGPSVGNCHWDGLPYHLQPTGRWCCINAHCVPAGS